MPSSSPERRFEKFPDSSPSMWNFRHKSFLFGVTLASVTWAASFYLYLVLTSTSNPEIRLTEATTQKRAEVYYDTQNVPLGDVAPQNGEERPRNYFPKNTVFLNNELYDKQEAMEEEMRPSPNNFVESPNVGKWRHKFQKLLGEQPPAVYKNTNKLEKTLQSHVKALDDEGKLQDIGGLGLLKTLEEKKIRDEGYAKHAFNTLVSKKLGFLRDIPDTRNPACKKQTYPTDLPDVTVIVCFYNEDFHTLMRTVHSVLDRTNPSLLHEVLLVDDSSDLDNIHENVMHYAQKNFPAKVQLLKTSRREGLIRARMFGARHATGDVLVFLDSHVEPNVHWAEPLLARISSDEKTIVLPIVDLINPDTFAYTPSPLVKGGFNWGLHFRWDNVPKDILKTDKDYVKPIASPTMSGGLFAIKKDLFTSLGEYDEGMDVWGGENLEISFRAWMCGSRMEIIPCSRVGHVFRKRRPYGSANGEDTATKNSVRVAEVWLDEYKHKFYEANPSAKHVEFGDISARVELRRQLKCKSFKWYLDTVYSDMIEEGKIPNNANTKVYVPWNKRERNYIKKFLLRLSKTFFCVESEGEAGHKNSALVLGKCGSTNKKKQHWLETDKHELVLGELLCLDASSEVPKVSKCHELGGGQQWKRSEDKHTPIFNLAAGQCLGVVGKPILGSQIQMVLCDESSERNKFDLIDVDGGEDL